MIVLNVSSGVSGDGGKAKGGSLSFINSAKVAVTPSVMVNHKSLLRVLDVWRSHMSWAIANFINEAQAAC